MENIQVVSIKMKKDFELEKKYSIPIKSPTETFNILREFIGSRDREYLVVMTLNTKNNINLISIVSIGSLNSAIVHPREVFKLAILSNACSIIIAHNHPSGDPAPSKEDVNITQRLKESGKILGIELLDHLIIGDNNFVSLKEKGLM